MSYKDLAAATQMQDADLKRTLQSLACDKLKLLVKDPKGRDVGEDDKFSFNTGFSHRMIKFKVSAISVKQETPEEVQASRAKMNEDRNPQIDAAIVRVMKARRHMNHNSLLIEVCRCARLTIQGPLIFPTCILQVTDTHSHLILSLSSCT